MSIILTRVLAASCDHQFVGGCACKNTRTMPPDSNIRENTLPQPAATHQEKVSCVILTV